MRGIVRFLETRPALTSRTTAVENVGEPRNSSTHLALMCAEKIMESPDPYSSRFGCRGDVDKLRHSFAACERCGSVRPKLRRAAMRRELHPYSRRDSREGRPRARCDNRGASACARTGCGDQERTAPRRGRRNKSLNRLARLNGGPFLPQSLRPHLNGSRVRREPPVRRTGAFQTSKCECAP